jgi:hypothetical protein
MTDCGSFFRPVRTRLTVVLSSPIFLDQGAWPPARAACLRSRAITSLTSKTSFIAVMDGTSLICVCDFRPLTDSAPRQRSSNKRTVFRSARFFYTQLNPNGSHLSASVIFNGPGLINRARSI